MVDLSFLKPNKANVIGTVLLIVVNLASGAISQPIIHMLGLSGASFVSGTRQFSGQTRGQFDPNSMPADFGSSGADAVGMQSGGLDMVLGKMLMSAISVVVFGLLSYVAIAFVVSMSANHAKADVHKQARSGRSRS